MPFARDIAVMREAVGNDPAFAGLELSDALDGLGDMDDPAAFLLAAMRVMARAGNGHSRVIPNGAIRGCPVRIVVRGAGFALLQDGVWHPLVSVNGTPVGTLFDRFRPYLAGTPMRQTVIGAILLAWPEALGTETVTYELDGHTAAFGPGDMGPLDALYPVGETGMREPGHDDHGLPDGAVLQWADPVWRVRLADMMRADPDKLADVAVMLKIRPRAGVVVDLRGNAGGDFTKALPLIEGLQDRAARCAVLVDRFTFSAAIVVAVLLSVRCEARLFGEEMGDRLRFWAEGGSTPLPESGATLRWSTGWHDWETGEPDATTPPDIARHMVGAGRAAIRPGAMGEATAWAAG